MNVPPVLETPILVCAGFAFKNIEPEAFFIVLPSIIHPNPATLPKKPDVADTLPAKVPSVAFILPWVSTEKLAKFMVIALSALRYCITLEPLAILNSPLPLKKAPVELAQSVPETLVGGPRCINWLSDDAVRFVAVKLSRSVVMLSPLEANVIKLSESLNILTLPLLSAKKPAPLESVLLVIVPK